MAQITKQYTFTNGTKADPTQVNADLDALFNQANAQDTQMGILSASISINPEKFTGTDYQKVQQALDYAITNDVSVQFNKIYDITGQGSLILNKANANSSIDRRVLYLIGVGGGIKKTDAGKIFTTNVTKTGDINVQGMRFYSTAGAGTIVWDADKIIRIMSSNCKYMGVDTVASAPTAFYQSMRFLNEHITDGNGWAFEFLGCYDTTLDVLIESRQNGIRNTAGQANLQNRGLRIRNCLFENLSGIAIQLGSCWSSEIDGNYFEANTGGHIDLQTLNQYYQYGLKISSNEFTMTAAQKTANTAAILWGNVFSGANSSCAVSESNVSDGVLHNILSGQTGYINSRGDYASGTFATGTLTKLINNSRDVTTNYGDGSVLNTSGLVNQMNQTVSSVTIAAGAQQNVIIPFQKGLSGSELFSVAIAPAYNIELQSVQIRSTDLYCWVKNMDAASKTITLTGVVYWINNA